MRQTASAFVLALLCALTLAPAFAAAPPWLGESYGETVSEEWMNVMLGGRKIGFSHRKVEKGDDGYRVTGRALIRLSLMGVTQDLSFSQSYYLDENKEVLGFISLKKIQSQRMRTVGTVKDGAVELEITGAGGTSKTSAALAPGTMFLETLPFQIASELRVGMKKTVPVFIIELRAMDNLTISVLDKKKMELDGKMAPVFVVEHTIQGLSSVSYMTPEGITVREEEPLMGITSVRVPEGEALSFPDGAVPVTSLITFSLIKPSGPVPPAPGSLKEMRMVIGGVDDPASIPSDARQMRLEAEWKTGPDGKRTASVPVVTFKAAPSQKVSIAGASRAEPEFLKPTPEAQSDNEMIKAKARDIVGDEKDAWAAARLINRWVHENVEKKLADSFTAVDVLNSMEGECQSHTNLFIALARSIGIPARAASGVVYSKENEGFLYHAWPEVFVGEWVAMDPTLGQEVAGVTHIKLAEGGLESQVKLVRFLGRISISIKSYE
ncbi:MAG: transglutaminase-like domain-containing protein [Candidatus Nitrospinota bacterium M3_3B_026]